MKFANTWKTFTNSLSNELLQQATLNYKKYKKLTKTCASLSAIQNSLQKDLLMVEQAYNKQVQHHASHFMQLLSCHVNNKKEVEASKHEVCEFVKFNSECFRKICKRLDKRLGVQYFTRWRDMTINNDNLEFLKRRNLVILEHVAHNQDLGECPICFERLNSVKDIVLHCGHVICVTCALGVLGLQGKKGTIPNLLAYGAYTNKHLSRCPVCRDSKAFLEYRIL